MTKNMLYSGLFLCVLLISCGGGKRLEADKNLAFRFEKSPTLARVLDKALAENKLVYLDISTSWCLPCKMMAADVYTHKPTADFINKHFVSYKVDAEKENGPDLAVVFNVSSYPTLLFLDTKGRVLERKEGATYHRELIASANRALRARPTLPVN